MVWRIDWLHFGVSHLTIPKYKMLWEPQPNHTKFITSTQQMLQSLHAATSRMWFSLKRNEDDDQKDAERWRKNLLKRWYVSLLLVLLRPAQWIPITNTKPFKTKNLVLSTFSQFKKSAFVVDVTVLGHCTNVPGRLTLCIQHREGKWSAKRHIVSSLAKWWTDVIANNRRDHLRMVHAERQ